MAVTRAQAEQILVSRIKGLQVAAGLAVTFAGANADLIEPISWAHRMLGGTTASVIAVTDLELATMVVADYDNFFNLAEWRALLNILGHLDDVDITTGPRSEKFSQLANQARERKDELLPLVKGLIAAAVDAPEMGYLTLSFREHSEESE